MPRTSFFYNRLNRRIAGLVKGRLWLQVLIAMGLGCLVGVGLGPDLDLVSRDLATLLGQWLALPGRIFLAMIQMIIIPLVASSIILGLTAAGAGTDLRRIGLRLGAFVLATTFVGALIGAGIARMVEAGRGMASGLPTARSPEPQDASQPPAAAIEDIGRELPDMITGLIPQNITRAILDQDMLAIVVFSLFIGIAVLVADKKDVARPLLALAEAVLEVCMTVIRVAMQFAPLAVFGLIANTMLTNGARTLVDLGLYVGAVLAGLMVLLLLYVAIAVVFGRIGPGAFVRAVAPVQLLAFSTSSSAAVMPLTMKTAVEKLGSPAPLAGAIVPLAATVNMAGTALYQAAAIVFLANVAGLTLGPFELALIMVTLTGASIGAPAAPGASVAVLSATAANFGIPLTGLALVLGVDRLLDMVRTAVNVTGDLVACRVLSRGVSQAVQPATDGAVAET